MSEVSYNRVNWQDSPSQNTPINATNLNKMDKGISDCAAEINNINNNSLAAISEQITQIGNMIGTLSNLNTTAKGNLVAAINELAGKVANMNVLRKTQNVRGSVTVSSRSSGTLTIGLSGFTNASKMVITNLIVDGAGIGIGINGAASVSTSAVSIPVYNGWENGSSTISISVSVAEFY